MEASNGDGGREKLSKMKGVYSEAAMAKPRVRNSQRLHRASAMPKQAPAPPLEPYLEDKRPFMPRTPTSPEVQEQYARRYTVMEVCMRYHVWDLSLTPAHFRRTTVGIGCRQDWKLAAHNTCPCMGWTCRRWRIPMLM
jgi:hypothetical protein